jgi:hypothetical protein
MNLSISETEMFSIAEVPQQHFHRYGYVVVNETCAKKNPPSLYDFLFAPPAMPFFLEKKRQTSLLFLISFDRITK